MTQVCHFIETVGQDGILSYSHADDRPRFVGCKELLMHRLGVRLPNWGVFLCVGFYDSIGEVFEV